jgi:hypothetical protein
MSHSFVRAHEALDAAGITGYAWCVDVPWGLRSIGSYDTFTRQSNFQAGSEATLKKFGSSLRPLGRFRAGDIPGRS